MTLISRRFLLGATGAIIATSTIHPTAPASSKASATNIKGLSFLITGTSSGFGKLGALHYARQGARVFATMRNLPRPESQDLTAIAEEEGLDLHVLPLDVLDDDQVADAVAEVEDRNDGPIDVLVNNAGILVAGPVELQDLEATKLAFDTNVFGCQRLARAVLPSMRQRGSGLIVNISSQAGRIVVPGFGLYCATKHAVEAMSEQLAYEVVEHGIDVAIIQPGAYPTQIAENGIANTTALMNRAEEKHVSGYPSSTSIMDGLAEVVANAESDPMDIPHLVAEIAASASENRSLRHPVHPDVNPQRLLNYVASQTQRLAFGRSAFGDAVKKVLKK